MLSFSLAIKIPQLILECNLLRHFSFMASYIQIPMVQNFNDVMKGKVMQVDMSETDNLIYAA